MTPTTPPEIIPLSILDGCEIVKWVGDEMALSWVDPPESPERVRDQVWAHESVPYLQLSYLDIHLAEGRALRLLSQLEDGSSFHGFFLLNLDRSEADSEPSPEWSIFRTRELDELPLGMAKLSIIRRDGPNALIEIELAIGHDVIRLLAAEVDEQLDGTFRICEPDESILVQLNGAVPARPTGA